MQRRRAQHVALADAPGKLFHVGAQAVGQGRRLDRGGAIATPGGLGNIGHGSGPSRKSAACQQ
jgi:hypothetical protein